jgi:hypothetical protein
VIHCGRSIRYRRAAVGEEQSGDGVGFSDRGDTNTRPAGCGFGIDNDSRGREPV